MKLRRLSFLSGLILFVAVARAQTASSLLMESDRSVAISRKSFKVRLSGKITDLRTGEPLPGASVYFADERMGTATDANGRYNLTNIPDGHHIVEISHSGYGTIVEHIELLTD